MNDDKDQFSPEAIVKQPTLGGTEEEKLDENVQRLTDDEWDKVAKLQGQNRQDGTVVTREEAIEQVLKER